MSEAEAEHEAGTVLFGIKESVTGRAWYLRPFSERAAGALRQQLDIPDVMARLLAQRGFDGPAAKRYLEPRLQTEMTDPMALAGMEAATGRLVQALEAGEAIAIFGDYDVDGATSAAILTRYFRALGHEAMVHIPDRLLEGYGPSEDALLSLRERGADLVITVDCGILSYKPLRTAKEAGLDVIVIDHHKAEPDLPEAAAIVNPNRLDDETELGHLAAVGVVFLTLVALNRRLREAGWFDREGITEPDLMGLLDLVALGTVCDVVPLTGLNRAFVAQGLRLMAARQNKGLAALADVAGMSEPPEAYHLGFLLGPRVNAGGRVGEAPMGARLLSTGDTAEATELARALDGFNQDRRAIEDTVREEAMAQVMAGRPAGECPFPLAMASSAGWHPGVIGIVAGRLKEQYGVPAFIFAEEGESAKGSARSIPGVDIGRIVLAARDAGLVVEGGGHAMAAGLTVERAKLDDFRAYMGEQLAERVAVAQAEARFQLDAVLDVGGATAELMDHLDRLEPFGPGNPAPRFAFEAVKIAKADIVGTAHVRAFLEGRGGARMKGISFRTAGEPLGDALLRNQGRRMHLAGRIKRDTWRGGDAVELHIADAAPAD